MIDSIKRILDEDRIGFEGKPHGWIQWKGTDVCIDLHCECQQETQMIGHFDGDFFYFYECSACGRKYAVGSTVKLIPLTKEEVTYVLTQIDGLYTDSGLREDAPGARRAGGCGLKYERPDTPGD